MKKNCNIVNRDEGLEEDFEAVGLKTVDFGGSVYNWRDEEMRERERKRSGSLENGVDANGNGRLVERPARWAPLRNFSGRSILILFLKLHFLVQKFWIIRDLVPQF